jgi:2-keto-3-deoxy-L-rhamnonate aldolase RhmA
VLVPHIDSVDAARGVVDSCRFPPYGHRSIYLANPLTGHVTVDPPAAVALLSEVTVVGLMVESVRGVNACDEIVAVDGVDLVVVGAFDLSAELGCLGDFDQPDFVAALTDVAAACRDHSVVLGLAGVTRPDQLARFVELGVRFVSAGTDASLFQAGARARLELLRAVPVPRSEGGPA